MGACASLHQLCSGRLDTLLAEWGVICRGHRSAGLADFVPHALVLGDDEVAAGAAAHKHIPPLLTAWLTGNSRQGGAEADI